MARAEMPMTSDPIRLIDDELLSDRLRDDLRAAGSASSSDYDVNAGLARFSSLVATGAVSATSAATAKGAVAAKAGVTALLAAKITAGVLLLGVVGAAVIFARDRANSPAPEAPVAAIEVGAEAPVPAREPIKQSVETSPPEDGAHNAIVAAPPPSAVKPLPHAAPTASSQPVLESASPAATGSAEAACFGERFAGSYWIGGGRSFARSGGDGGPRRSARGCAERSCARRRDGFGGTDALSEGCLRSRA